MSASLLGSPHIAECLVHIRLFIMLANEWRICLASAYLLHLDIHIAAKVVSLASNSDELLLPLGAPEWLEG